MAMKPYSHVSYGKTVVTASNGSIAQSMTVCAIRALSGVLTRNGDRVNPNPHTYTTVRTRGLVGSTTHRYAGALSSMVSGVCTTPFNYTMGLPSGFEGSAASAALSDAYESLRGSVDLSIDLVQYRKVIAMVSIHRRLVKGIADTGRRLISKIELVERHKRELQSARTAKSAKRVTRLLNRSLNMLADARLEAVYGWGPTMSTLHELRKGALRRNFGYLKVEGIGGMSRNYVVKGGYVDGRVPIYHYISHSERSRVVMFFAPTPSVLDNLSRISSLNPVSVLYEATPFSFVLDWAFEFGNWFRTLETAFLHRNDFVRGYQTTSQRLLVDATMNGSYTYNTVQYTAHSWSGTAVQVKFQRSVLSTAPYPAKPVRRFDFSAARTLNALSLAKATLFRADGLLANHLRR